MPELAEMVTLDLARKKMFVNGEEFPWYISEVGPKLGGIMAAGELRSVTLTFFAKDVEVIPEGPLEVDEAQRRVDRAQRELADAQKAVQDATADAVEAQEDFTTAKAVAERLVESQ